MDRTRFSDALWSKRSEKIIIGGAGGIGSWVCLYLSRIGHEIYVFDNDNVEEVNMAGQFFSNSNLLKTKVEAIKQNCMSFAPTKITAFNELYTEESFAGPIMFSCFDNMKARRTMFDRWCEENKNSDRCIFIDGRMTAELGHVYFVTKDRIEDYRKTLFADEEGADLPCSFKATTHNGAMIASIMVSGLNNYIFNTHELVEDYIRSVPFETKYFLDSLTFNVN